MTAFRSDRAGVLGGRQVPVAEVVQAHLLLNMFEAVQVRERQAVDLRSGSTVITEQMVTEPAAPHGGLPLPGPKGSVPKATAERPAGWPVCAGHFSPPPVLVGWGQDDGARTIGPGHGMVFGAPRSVLGPRPIGAGVRGMDTVGRRRALGGETPIRRSAARPRRRPARGAELHTNMRRVQIRQTPR